MDRESFRKELVRSIERYVPENPREAALHYVNEQASFFRPFCVFKTHVLLGGKDPSEVKDLALSVELIHLFSLIYDDMPFMDDAKERRGVPACHRVYGLDGASLAGLVVLGRAFDLLAPYGTLVQRRALAAFRDMCEGQYMDLSGEVSLEVHEKKTGALFGLAFYFGGIQSDRVRDEVLYELGVSLGRLYQIKDDLEDVDGLCLAMDRQELLELYEDEKKRSTRSLPPFSGVMSFPIFSGTSPALRRESGCFPPTSSLLIFRFHLPRSLGECVYKIKSTIG